jgi:hypothetical protein
LVGDSQPLRHIKLRKSAGWAIVPVAPTRAFFVEVPTDSLALPSFSWDEGHTFYGIRVDHESGHPLLRATELRGRPDLSAFIAESIQKYL